MESELNMIKFFEKDSFAKTAGIILKSVTIGNAVAVMEIKPMHKNAAGGVQGGAIFTLADFAFAAAVNSYGFLTVGVTSNIQFFKQAKGKCLKAIAAETSRGRTICGCKVDIYDEDESLIALFTGTRYIKETKIF